MAAKRTWYQCLFVEIERTEGTGDRVELIHATLVRARGKRENIIIAVSGRSKTMLYTRKEA